MIEHQQGRYGEALAVAARYFDLMRSGDSRGQAGAIVR